MVRLVLVAILLSFTFSVGLQDAQAGRGKLIWDGTKWVVKTVRDGAAYDAMKKGGRKTRDFYNERIRDSNRVEYKAPRGRECGYVTTYSVTGKVRYKRLCN